MTSRTARQYLWTLNLEFRFPGDTAFQVFGALVFCAPRHVENSLLRPQEPFRLAMTLQTPLHLQRRGRKRDRHLIDSAVTRRTADAFVHVNTVIEICIVGKIVNANPLDRFAGAKTGAHRFEIWTVGPDLDRKSTRLNSSHLVIS